jgi:hypothetical protein
VFAQPAGAVASDFGRTVRAPIVLGPAALLGERPARPAGGKADPPCPEHDAVMMPATIPRTANLFM